MAENLNKRPSKGILKIPKTVKSDSLDKDIKWDETNIQQTLHPDDKDYGFIKIEEPPTPYNRNDDDASNSEDEANNDSLRQIDLLEKVSRQLKEPPVAIEDEKIEKLLGGNDLNQFDTDEQSMDTQEPLPSTSKTPTSFELKRKRHYNEFQAMRIAKKLLDEENRSGSREDS